MQVVSEMTVAAQLCTRIGFGTSASLEEKEKRILQNISFEISRETDDKKELHFIHNKDNKYFQQKWTYVKWNFVQWP